MSSGSRSRKKSMIPVGTQFSPDLINLSSYVKMVVKHSGTLDKLRDAVVKAPVRKKDYCDNPTNRMMNLPLEAGVQYGLLEEKTYKATELSKKLANLKEPKIYEEFAKHILLKLGWLRVVEAAQEMALDQRKITGDTLAQYLTNQGFQVTEHNTAINTIRMWLAKAGLFPENGRKSGAWIPDKLVKKKLIGMDDKMIAALAMLDSHQIAYVKALCRLEPKNWISASDVRDLAEVTFGVRFGRSSLPKEVLKPLKSAGLIDFKTGGTKQGKTSMMKLTNKFHSDVLKPFLDNALSDLNTALTAYYKTRPEDFFKDLDSKDKYKKGYALEAFTIFVMRLLGLRFQGWRKRAQETGFSEVDALLAGLFGGMPTTWQVQCKNTPTSLIRLEDIAKEVGLLPLTHATHILFIANAKFTSDAIKYAREIMLNSSVTIFLLNKDDYESIKNNPANIGSILQNQAENIRDIRINSPIWGVIENE